MPLVEIPKPQLILKGSHVYSQPDAICYDAEGIAQYTTLLIITPARLW